MDIQQATQFARHMILEWGMSDRLGFVHYAGTDARDAYIPDRDYSDVTARIIDEEVKRIIDEAFSGAERIVDEYWDKIVAVADALLKYETLQGDEVRRLVAGERLDKPTVAELLEQEAAKSGTPEPRTTPKSDEGEAPAGGDVVPSPA